MPLTRMPVGAVGRNDAAQNGYATHRAGGRRGADDNEQSRGGRVARTWIASLTNGIVAGATATLARELISNLDVGIRARPTSDTHERAVQRMADVTHVNLGPAERAAHRRAGIGSVFGFVNGVLAVSLFAAFRGRRRPPLPVAAGVIGIGGMLVADGSMTALGVTDPRRWGAEGWFEDALPYVAYGLVAAATLNRLDGAD